MDEEALIPADRQEDHAPYALSATGELEGALRNAGLTVVLDREQPGDWRYPDLERAPRGLLGSAGGARAISLVGEERVRAAVTEALDPFRDDEGAYVMHNHFRLLVAEKAA